MAWAFGAAAMGMDVAGRQRDRLRCRSLGPAQASTTVRLEYHRHDTSVRSRTLHRPDDCDAAAIVESRDAAPRTLDRVLHASRARALQVTRDLRTCPQPYGYSVTDIASAAESLDGVLRTPTSDEAR